MFAPTTYYSVLSFDWKKETWCETVYVQYTWSPVFFRCSKKFNYWLYYLLSVFVECKLFHFSPCTGGKCESSKSPCVIAISHHMTANPSQESMKLSANIIRVQRHWESTSVVKMSCRKRILLWDIFFCDTLQSLWGIIHIARCCGIYIYIVYFLNQTYPFFRTARLRIFLYAEGRKLRLLDGKVIQIMLRQIRMENYSSTRNYSSIIESY